ncbi:unnamed protein product [Effrenium voratum]|nr:unnamed protein product [Effrenium voratum]
MPQAVEDAEALLEKELEQIDARLASLQATPRERPGQQSKAVPKAKFAPAQRAGSAPKSARVSRPSGVNPEDRANRSTASGGLATPRKPPAAAPKVQPKASPKLSAAKSPGPVPRVSKGREGSAGGQPKAEPKPKPKPKAKDAPKMGESSERRRGAMRNGGSMDVTPQFLTSLGSLGALGSSEQTVSVSLEAAAADLLEVEFSKCLFSTQCPSHIPPAIDMPPADTTLRKFAAVVERVLPAGNKEVQPKPRSLLNLA